MTIQPLNVPSAQPAARTYALLSVGAALLTIMLKSTAYRLTGSVGLLSDALESGVNLVAALVAVWALTLAIRPADADHSYGHSKAEYIASAVEGIMILVAAVSIGWAAVDRLFHPRAGAGLAGFGDLAGRRRHQRRCRADLAARWQPLRSITLRADAHHLLTDVWTSAGVVVGVVLVARTGWLILDPLIALLVAVNIIWAAIRILRDTAGGILDQALPLDERAQITGILSIYGAQGVTVHALRTRAAGQRRFVSLHILVPGDWSIQRGHNLAEQIEQQIRAALPKSTVFTHLEPKEDAKSYEDQDLERPPQSSSQAQP